MLKPIVGLYRAGKIAAISATLTIVLSSCATTESYWYAGAGAGYKANADWLLREENGGGRNPTAHFSIGKRWEGHRFAKQCEVNHWSHYRDGGPFNNLPETYKDEVICEGFVKFGHRSKK